jgi:hypothetical protein
MGSALAARRPRALIRPPAPCRPRERGPEHKRKSAHRMCTFVLLPRELAVGEHTELIWAISARKLPLNLLEHA